jgi:hypothetical protein
LIKSRTGDANAAGFGDALKTSSDVHAVAIDALLVVDNVAEVDAYAVAHLTFRRNAGIALGHHFREGNRALDCIHNTGELGKDAIAACPKTLNANWPLFSRPISRATARSWVPTRKQPFATSKPTKR